MNAPAVIPLPPPTNMLSPVSPLSTGPETQTPDAPAKPPRVRLMGMPIDPVTHAQAIRHIIDSLNSARGGWAITPNLDQLRLYTKNASLRDFYEQAELVLADGMPLLWAARLAGRPLPQRVAGSELIYTLSQAAAQAGRSIFLLGGAPGTAQGAADKLLELYPAIQIKGHHCPPMGFEKVPSEMQRIRELLRQAKPDIVFVGLGFPKQEHLIRAVRSELPAAWFLGIGVSFSFVSGQIHRAPRWLQQIGLEWVHRMAQEPGRLFKRYIIHGLPFAARLLWWALRAS